MKTNFKDISTQCVHAGTIVDDNSNGVLSTIQTSTAFRYLDEEDTQRYPRYFNIPNHDAVVSKLCALEKSEDGLLFGSGMGAISTTLLSILKKGDHLVMQSGVYGGTHSFACNELPKLGVEVTFTKGCSTSDFKSEIKPHTRAIYIETPSNPTLDIVDLESINKLAKANNLLIVIDSTFATPINQNPISFGIDIVLHSGTKYLGGHSDLCCGAVLSSKELIDRIRTSALHFGASMNATNCALLERSLKTLQIRVQRQNENALFLAQKLEANPSIKQVHYPGLNSHLQHKLAASQMRAFGGMISFELNDIAPKDFMENLQLIQPALSLGGIESTICQPATTSHRTLSDEERQAQGIAFNMVRLSVGIESPEELLEDIELSLHNTKSKNDSTIK